MFSNFIQKYSWLGGHITTLVLTPVDDLDWLGQGEREEEGQGET